jgi:CubicO group peptidase (beta-lactamase class C family)
MTGAGEADRRCSRLLAELQASARIPGVCAAVVRPDRPAWLGSVGSAKSGVPAAAGTRFRIGSITKTFTAVLVLRQRDAGRLDLDDDIGDHLDVPRHGALTIRRLLAHTSGLQREPPGDVWDSLEMPSPAELVSGLADAEAVSAPGRRWHYSNLAFALLGEVVGRTAGTPWSDALQRELLDPLALGGIGPTAGPDAADGFLVEPYTDVVHLEPRLDRGGFDPAGCLWGTALDVARFMAFLDRPDPAVLAPASAEEMCEPQALIGARSGDRAYGLGLELAFRAGAVDAGHLGAMPGFLAAAFARRGAGAAAAVLGNSGTAHALHELPHALLDASLAADPPPVEAWLPGEPPPAALADVPGRWWAEGVEEIFSWRRGRLEARGAADPPGLEPAVFGPAEGLGPDVLRTLSGREAGELLRLTRDAEGRVSHMHWATYRLTREQRGFARS